ncbi:type VI secretion system lipoprotein TssJ, partial [Mesorhizobium sp. M7A.F.Ca.US.007.01.1.1]
MIDRREFVVALGATGLLAACQSGPPKPSVITVNVNGGAGMNPGPGGGDRPGTILV